MIRTTLSNSISLQRSFIGIKRPQTLLSVHPHLLTISRHHCSIFYHRHHLILALLPTTQRTTTLFRLNYNNLMLCQNGAITFSFYDSSCSFCDWSKCRSNKESHMGTFLLPTTPAGSPIALLHWPRHHAHCKQLYTFIGAHFFLSNYTNIWKQVVRNVFLSTLFSKFATQHSKREEKIETRKAMNRPKGHAVVLPPSHSLLKIHTHLKSRTMLRSKAQSWTLQSSAKEIQKIGMFYFVICTKRGLHGGACGNTTWFLLSQ